jgi:phytoene synthase
MDQPSIEVATDGAAHAALVVERVRRSGSSFTLGMRLLEPRRRMAMFAVYAFCREVDDIADGPGSPAERQRQLAAWRGEIASLYGGRPAFPLAQALIGPVAEFDLQQADLLAVIDGVAMDAREEMVRPDLATLDLYCDRVACAVGRLSVRIFGGFTAQSLVVADSLGRALQLTNILRDVAEDAQIGRLYMPDELLDAHGIDGRDPRAVLAHPALPLVCRDLGAMARRHFAAAWAAMDGCSHRAMRPAALMGAVYQILLDRLEAANWLPTQQTVRVPRVLKIWCALRYGLFW